MKPLAIASDISRNLNIYFLRTLNGKIRMATDKGLRHLHSFLIDSLVIRNYTVFAGLHGTEQIQIAGLSLRTKERESAEGTAQPVRCHGPVVSSKEVNSFI